MSFDLSNSDARPLQVCGYVFGKTRGVYCRRVAATIAFKPEACGFKDVLGFKGVFRFTIGVATDQGKFGVLLAENLKIFVHHKHLHLLCYSVYAFLVLMIVELKI